MNDPLQVLFLCSGNSCRSQMAEGFLRQMGAGRVEVKSAGIEAHGLDPRAITVMAEVGVDILEQALKDVKAGLVPDSAVKDYTGF